MKNPSREIFDTKMETIRVKTAIAGQTLGMFAFTERNLTSMDCLMLATEYEMLIAEYVKGNK